MWGCVCFNIGFFRCASPNSTASHRRSRGVSPAIPARQGIGDAVGAVISRKELGVAGGLSFLAGKGDSIRATMPPRAPSPGVNLNENDIIDAGELTAVPATAGTPNSQSPYSRWAMGAAFTGVTADTRLGRSRVYGGFLAAATPIAVSSPIKIPSPACRCSAVGYYVALIRDNHPLRSPSASRMVALRAQCRFLRQARRQQIPRDSTYAHIFRPW